MKKFLSLILCTAMIAPVTASAAAVPTKEITSTVYSESTKSGSTVTVPFSAKKGDTVTFYITVKNAPSIAGLLCELSYKYSRRVDNAAYFDNSYIYSENNVTHLSVLFNQEGADLSNETTVASITLKAARDISESDEAFNFTVLECYDSNLAEIDHSNVSCKLNGGDTPVNPPHVHTIVTDPDSPKHDDGDSDSDGTKNIYGDVDGDGKITSSDSLAVLRNSVGLQEFSETQKILANVDGDDLITSADALDILRYSVNLPASEQMGETYNP